MIPTGSTLNWRQGESSFLACTGSKSKNNPNAFIEGKLNKIGEQNSRDPLIFYFPDNRSSATLFCSGGKNFRSNDNVFPISHFAECKHPVNGDIINRNVKCGNNNGILLNIGFQLSDGKGFVNYIDVCYNKTRASPVYTKHVIYGGAIKGFYSFYHCHFI
jgi:hypothetical protein